MKLPQNIPDNSSEEDLICDFKRLEKQEKRVSRSKSKRKNKSRAKPVVLARTEPHTLRKLESADDNDYQNTAFSPC